MSRVSERQEMRLRRLAGVDHEGPCVVCLKKLNFILKAIGNN